MRPTKSFHGVKPESRFRTLPEGTSVYEVADRSRASGLELLRGIRTRRWSRIELGAWLLRSYGRAVLSIDETVVELRARPQLRLDVRDEEVARLLDETSARVIHRLKDCARTWAISGFARDMVEGGYVVGVSDSYGGIGYAPIDDGSMRFADRVIALFVADYLTRPRDYESLAICESCEDVSFSFAESHDVGCSRTPHSGVIARGMRRSTRRGVGT
jgi:hypothetical protein